MEAYRHGGTMARRRRKQDESVLALIAGAPWPVGLVLGVLGFIGVRYGIGWAGSQGDNPYLIALTAGFRDGPLAALAWAVLGLCWSAAFVSVYSRWTLRRRENAPSSKAAKRQAPRWEMEPSQAPSGGSVRVLPVDSSQPAPPTRENIANLSWLQFEHVIAASFRAKGFTAELTADGADEGIDIVLRERDNVLLVQCKHWLSQRVGVATVRALYGVMHAKNARKAIIATSHRLTADAQRFCEDNAIYCIDADNLMAFVDPAAMPAQADIDPDRQSRCPMCGADMVRQTARASKQAFWGCSRYPACQGRRFAKA